MGGGSGFTYSDTSDLNKKLKESQDDLAHQNYDSEVNALLNEQLIDANRRETEALNKHMEEIKKAIEKEFEDSESIISRFGGSISKHTYVDGLSDIDVLVIMNNTDLKNKSPEEIKKYFHDKLKQRFSNTTIDKGNLAVTVNFNDMQIQLLPAIKYESGVKIANRIGTEWSNIIRPHVFSRALSIRNSKLNGNLIPIIKSIKSIISDYPKERKLSGYHVEALAYEVFSNYNGKLNKKEMISHFFENAPNRVRNPIKDRTGQSKYVDSYLGGKTSLNRLMVADSLERANRNIKDADNNLYIDFWKSFL